MVTVRILSRYCWTKHASMIRILIVYCARVATSEVGAAVSPVDHLPTDSRLSVKTFLENAELRLKSSEKLVFNAPSNWLQKSASLQLRTGRLKFANVFRIVFHFDEPC